MNIGIFTNAYKPMISGVVNSIELIRRGMRSLGHRVYVFAPKFFGYRDTEIGVFRFASVNLSTQVQYPLAIPFSPRIFAILNRIKLDVVHSHHPFLLGKLGANVARRKDIPLVYTFHTQYEQYSHYIPLFPRDVVRMVARVSVKNYANDCNLIVCPSPAIFSLIEEYGITAPVSLIPNAVDIAQFRNVDPEPVRKRYGITDSDKVLVYVGRMGKEKNLDFLLEAFKKAQQAVPDAKLMIVGEGPELESLKEHASSLGIGDRVVFPGRVEYSSIPAYYGASCAFVITSVTEVKPLAILEALASSLPVVAVSAVGSSDTITHEMDGLLTGMDLEEYSQALIRILKDPELRDNLAQGAQKTSDRYSITGTAKTLENMYLELIRKHQENRITTPI